ncbi:hybrid sensor histidine kinase/response regulator transcription factor [Labilibacter marinus]|uniref:hybrid sensor histidine kinase/response regulator transcription factor n=1 Tax=Labilibacter marinus TaxID=1477105 RepID=UPI00095008E9|nr:hybrid sensor histidine kinase/response regulator transcription factor [Labilibacter marinus]
MKRILIILLVSIGFLSVVSAQKQYSFLQVNNVDGLVNDRVVCIHKDSRGFIWFGTKAGLSRYDGSGFVNYKHDSSDSTSIFDNYILNITEDRKGNLLIHSSIGHFVFDVTKERFIRYINEYLGLKAGLPYIEKVYKDEGSNMWIKRHQHAYYNKVNEKENTTEDLFPYKKEPGIETVDFKHVNGNYYYLFSDGTIECYDSTYRLKFKDDFLVGKLEGGSFTPALYVDKENDIWFYGNNNGVYHFNALTHDWYNYSQNAGKIRLSNNIIYKIIQDDKGLIWVATDHGGINIINKYSGQVSHIYHQSENPKSIADNSVTDLYMDDNNIIWAATNKSGVSYYHESIHKFPHYRNLSSDDKSLPFSDVNCFSEDKKGNLWIGTNGGGLIYYNRKEHKYTTYKHRKDDLNSLSSNVVMALLIDHNEELWIGTYAGGVNRFDGKYFKRYQFKTQSAQGLSHNNIWSIVEDEEQNIWISTNGGGIEKYNAVNDSFYKPVNQGKIDVPTNHVADLHILSDGNVLIGSAFGAFLYDTKEKRYKNIVGLDSYESNNKSCNAVYEDSRGLYWIATNEGLIVIDPMTSFLKQFNSKDGLPEDIMNGIVEDEFQTIWVSKSTGLSQIVVSKSKGDEAYGFEFSHFTEEDGLQSNEFNPNACYKTNNNELIFGGVNGFNIFKSKNIRSNNVLPKVVFTDLQVYYQSIFPEAKVKNVQLLDKSISLTEEVELKHAMNIFSVSFSALNFFIPDKIQYQYKLEGFNDEWLLLDNKQPKISYTNLDAGEYALKVKAANNDGIWNKEYAELKIIILPPLFATKWAFIIYGLIIIGLVIYYRYMMVRKERMKFAIEQERLLAKQNHEMDEMKLRFLTNVSHEFRTPLTLILTPLHKLLEQTESPGNKKLLEVIDRNARNLLGLVNQLLDFRKLELHGMRYNPSFGNIVVFLQKVMKDFEDAFSKKNIDFDFHHEVNEFMLSFDSDKLHKVMMNLLSNALKFTPENGKVTIVLNVDEAKDLIHISVSDTGIGIKKEDVDKIFERFFQSDNNKKMGYSGSGIGLNLTREMIQLHNGTISVDSTMGKGTSFKVCLPVEVIEEAVIEEEILDEVEELEPEVNEEEKKEKSTILLVEDNLDFRSFMKETLQDKFIIHEAADGQIGYDSVHNVLPDLIISDVMMPNVDGLELCQMLRKDIRTSHIPIILLTARTADEDKIKGLEIGADDYITKPFNMDLLMLRVNNLLQKRSKMQKQFQKTVDISPSEVQITSMDEKLIKKAVAIVEENIAEAGFSVEDLSKELGMSRVYLYKKLTAITGKSPIEFMRIIRLKRGAQLLEKSQMNIAEVAYQVGFNSPRYFSKYFKEEYGMLPTAYVKAKATEAKA